ncbi:MAG: tRNA-dihydrouridine synthase family protein [Verrucomicrobiota bacterium]
MQDVTDLPFWNLLSAYEGPDLYFTEYFRVHPDSVLDPAILKSITSNPTGRPVIAQMIGNHIPSLVRCARELQNYPVVGIDLNLGCPMPVIYRKNAGGGLLREIGQIEAILGALRHVIDTSFTVKTRIGFDDPAIFEDLLAVYARHSLDLLSVHGRTVAEKYRSTVHYDYIARAVEVMPCPVLANGNVISAGKARFVLDQTSARGLMVGRGAIRNPWLFRQVRQELRGEALFVPTGQDVLSYIHALYEMRLNPEIREVSHVQQMKKYMNYIGLGVEPSGRFLHEIRRVNTHADFFRLCHEFLDHNEPMPLVPFDIPLKASDFMCGEHC